MFRRYDPVVARAEAALFQAIINGIKRRPEDVATELGISLEHITAILDAKPMIDFDGCLEAALTDEVIAKAVKHWPVNERDFYPLHDDAPDGVKIMRAADSEKSSRIMYRAGKPYYDYRDTATTRVTLFRPEWILELHTLPMGAAADDPTAQWNNGHFEHQFTYYIGPVTLWVKQGDKPEVFEMNTGDSTYFTPFVPHTFATRVGDPRYPTDQKGLILALTFGDKLSGDVQQELAAVGPGLARQFAMDFSSMSRAFASLLAFYMDAGSVTPRELSDRLLRIKKSRRYRIDGIHTYLSGTSLPSYSEVEDIAHMLGITPRELLPEAIAPKVIVQPYGTARQWNYPTENPSYQMVELARTPAMPHMKALEVQLIKRHFPAQTILTGLHQYVYNIGDKPVNLNVVHPGLPPRDYPWMVYQLQPNDSAYLKPNIEHCFEGEGGKLLVLRIGGRIAGEPMRQLSLVADPNRAIAETMPWFDAAGYNPTRSSERHS